MSCLLDGVAVLEQPFDGFATTIAFGVYQRDSHIIGREYKWCKGKKFRMDLMNWTKAISIAVSSCMMALSTRLSETSYSTDVETPFRGPTYQDSADISVPQRRGEEGPACQ